MGKTVSLKLNSEEERIVNHIIKKGISPSELLRDALLNYFGSVQHEVDQKVNLNLHEEEVEKVDQENHKVNLFQEREVNLVDQTVNHFQEEPVNQVNKKVNLLQEEKVDQLNQYSKYLDLYISQLNSNICQLKDEKQEWKSRYDGEIQYIKHSYSSLQTEFYIQIKDFIKRIDDKFDRVMFYLEESRKPILQTNYIKTESKSEPDVINENFKKKENSIAEKTKKGFVFKMYRM